MTDRHPVDVRLAQGPLRPPLRMRLDIDHWSAASTALTLIPCQRVRLTAAYFQAGRRLLDALIRALPAPKPAQHPLIRSPTRQPPAHPGTPPARPAGEQGIPGVRQPVANELARTLAT